MEIPNDNHGKLFRSLNAGIDALLKAVEEERQPTIWMTGKKPVDPDELMATRLSHEK